MNPSLLLDTLTPTFNRLLPALSMGSADADALTDLIIATRAAGGGQSMVSPLLERLDEWAEANEVCMAAEQIVSDRILSNLTELVEALTV